MTEVLILVFGYNRTLPNWEDCMWGNPSEGVYGRASCALRIAEDYRAPLIFLGGGGVIADDGVSDASAARTLIIERAGEMYGCSCKSGSCSLKILNERIYLDNDARNTAEELKNAFAVCLEKKIPKIILISSSTHIARCLQLALVYKEANDGCVIDIQAHPSDVNYPDATAEDVVIIESPHLPNSDGIPWHKLVKRMIPWVKGNEGSEAFAEDIKALLDRYECVKKK